MANATVSNLGQINTSGATDALFLKLFAGEVLTTFHKKTQFLTRHMLRTIAHGKSAQFPGTGRSSAAYHTPGAEIVGNAIPHAETVIAIDDLLVASAFIALIDEAKNHYDVRSIYSGEIADALYQTFDGNVAKVGILAARASSALSSVSLPTRAFTQANFRTDGELLASGIFSGAQALDEGNVSAEDRFAAVLPAQYYLLAQTTKLINKDWGGSGVYADGSILKVGGVEIVKTNNLPQANVSTGPTAYQGNFTNTAALVWQKGAMGTVKLLDLATEMAYDIRRQGTLLVAKYAMGHGVLRPECAVELKVA
jgi:hypothetical protein